MRALLKASWAMAILLVVQSWASAQVPTITAPAEITGEVSAFVIVKAETKNANWVRYVPLDPGLSVFPSDLLADRTVTVVVASKAGRYRVLAYTGNDEGGAQAIVTLVIGKVETPGKEPPKTDPPIEPGVDPPAKPAGKVFFLIVRADGPATQDYARIMADPAWDAHRKAGIIVKDKTFSESKAIYTAPSGTTLPYVVTLSSGETESKVIAGPVPLPTTSAGIADLAKGIK